MKWMLACAAATLLMLAQLSAANDVFAGREGRVRAIVLTDIETLPLNEIHSWDVRFENADGVALEGASVKVTGGMPVHDHGLPTEPLAHEKAPGVFRVEGVRFHMHGSWEMIFEVRVQAEAGESKTDTVKVSFEL